MAADRVIIGKMVLPLFSRLFLIGSFLYMQVMRTCVNARRNSKFAKIGPPTAELGALERLKKIPIDLYWGRGGGGVATFSQLFLIGSFSYLQVFTMTYIRAWMSS